MELTTEQYIRLQRFLDFEMTMEEMEVFERELDRTPELKEQLEFEQKVKEAFLTKQNESTENVLEQPQVSIKRFHFTGWAVAASLLAVILSTAVIIINSGSSQQLSEVVIKSAADSSLLKEKPVVKVQQQQDSLMVTNEKTEALYKQYYRKPSVPDEYPVYLAEAFDKYTENDYSGFDVIEENTDFRTRGAYEDSLEVKAMVLFYKGVISLERKQPDKATLYFKKAQESLQNKNHKLGEVIE